MSDTPVQPAQRKKFNNLTPKQMKIFWMLSPLAVFGFWAINRDLHGFDSGASATSGTAITQSTPKEVALSLSDQVTKVLSSGGTITVADITTGKREKLQVSNGWLTPPVGNAGQITSFSSPTANCQGIEQADIYGNPLRFLLCQNATPNPVSGYDDKGNPVTLPVPKGDWYYEFEFTGPGVRSPGISKIMLAEAS